jgi:hypothetical protein
MENPNTPHPELSSAQMATAAVGSEYENQSASESAPAETDTTQPKSYQRSRNVALMKLAFLRPEIDNPE